MSNLKGCEFWIEPTCYYATTGGGGYQVHKAYSENMADPKGTVCFVEKSRLNIATARIAELEELRESLKKTIAAQQNALEELTK